MVRLLRRGRDGDGDGDGVGEWTAAGLPDVIAADLRGNVDVDASREERGLLGVVQPGRFLAHPVVVESSRVAERRGKISGKVHVDVNHVMRRGYKKKNEGGCDRRSKKEPSIIRVCKRPGARAEPEPEREEIRCDYGHRMCCW